MKQLLVLLVLALIVNTTAISDSSANLKDKKCMAEVIYRESRGEPYLGQLAVGQVVINRAKHYLFPNTICEVLFQKGQFPWTKNFDGFKAPHSFLPLAELVLSGKHELATFKATHFHATYVDPKWKLRKVTQIGNHIFYKI